MRNIILVCISIVALAAGQFPTCQKKNTAFCESPVSGVTPNNIIFRCPYGGGAKSVPGNCNDDLAEVPPKGVKYAQCWETSPTTGDAQCVFDCVSVTAANGTTFFPLGCKRKDIPPYGSATTSTSLRSFAQPSTTSSLKSTTSSKSRATQTSRPENLVLPVLAFVGALAI